MNRVRTLQDVVDWGLCVGCGACAYACKTGSVRMVDVESVGMRPQIAPGSCEQCSDCLSVCPGVGFDGRASTKAAGSGATDHPLFGPTLAIYEGAAQDPEIRHAGSSGGVVTALSLYCLEKENMAFVLHTGTKPETPLRCETVTSKNRSELLSRTGSRYAPAAPCDGLKAIEESDRPCVFVGKPCDAEAVFMASRQRPKLAEKLGLSITFFCAGTPSTLGTKSLLGNMDVGTTTIKELRYRGNGWPGAFTARSASQPQPKTMSYESSWGFLQRFRPFRCHLCPDGLGRAADIACGDAWHHHAGESNPGRSLILVRTPRGMEILQRAIRAGYVAIERPATAEDVVAAQRNLLSRVQLLFGRLLAMRLLAIPAPRFPGFFLPENFGKAPLTKRLKTLAGTLRRLVQRGLWHRTRMPVVAPDSKKANGR